MKNLFLYVSLLGMVMLAGCQGSGTEGVTGTVTLDSQPLSDAEVVFTPENGGRPASAVTNESGEYDLRYTVDKPGAPAGKYSVVIRTGTSKIGADGNEEQVPEVVPAKYNRRSELTAEIVEGETNRFDFELESDK